jgi:hypothetical protein
LKNAKHGGRSARGKPTPFAPRSLLSRRLRPERSSVHEGQDFFCKALEAFDHWTEMEKHELDARFS